MYYSSSGSYRKTRTTMDFILVIMAVLILTLFIALIFWQSKRNILFPAIFMAGALSNGISAVKYFMNSNKKSGIILIIGTILLFLLSVACWNTMVI